MKETRILFRLHRAEAAFLICCQYEHRKIPQSRFGP